MPVNFSQCCEALPLEGIGVERGGSKSSACGLLSSLSEQGGFKTPAGCCIPFGAMEAMVQASGQAEPFKRLLAQMEDEPVEHLDSICRTARHLVSTLRPPSAVIESISTLLGVDLGTALIVRSSANVEDLAGMSGAGLYDSIPNV